MRAQQLQFFLLVLVKIVVNHERSSLYGFRSLLDAKIIKDILLIPASAKFIDLAGCRFSFAS